VFRSVACSRDEGFLQSFSILSFLFSLELNESNYKFCRSQWPRGLRRRSAAAWLLGSRVRIPFGAWMFVVLSCVGRGLCDGLITRPEGSYRGSNCMITQTLWLGKTSAVRKFLIKKYKFLCHTPTQQTRGTSGTSWHLL
jgi:hypothetical protein